MCCLQTLRQTRWLTRLVLVWFALFIGAAAASPAIQPVTGQMVCTAMGGMKMVTDTDGDPGSQASTGMDCPLCAPLIAPIAPQTAAWPPPGALAHGWLPRTPAHPPGLSGAPLPPRGPPALF